MEFRRQDTEPKAPEQAVTASPRTGQSSKEAITTLGPDTEIEGTLKFRHTLIMQGKFKGSIDTEGHVEVGETGSVEAEINAGSIIIAGKVNGNITASDIIDLRQKAELHGDIKSAKLRIDEGVVFVGNADIMPQERRKTP